MTHMKMWPFVVPSAPEYPVSYTQEIVELAVYTWSIYVGSNKNRTMDSTYQLLALQPDPPTSVPCKDNCSQNVYKLAEVCREQIAKEYVIARNVDIYVLSTDFSSSAAAKLKISSQLSTFW